MQGKQDQSGCAGCLGWGGSVFAVIVVISVLFGIWATKGDTSATKIPFEFTIEVNQRMVELLRLGSGECDLSWYEVEVYDGTGKHLTSRERVGRFELGQGFMVDNVFCQYTLRGEIDEHDRYAVKIATMVGDPNIRSKVVDWSGNEGETLRASLRWYSPVDGDWESASRAGALHG